jgi:hypothetical protein
MSLELYNDATHTANTQVLRKQLLDETLGIFGALVFWQTRAHSRRGRRYPRRPPVRRGGTAMTQCPLGDRRHGRAQQAQAKGWHAAGGRDVYCRGARAKPLERSHKQWDRLGEQQLYAAV